ncbi:glyoxalase [Nocardia nova]|uniref:Glyoxalase n=1 Tax=Nocardia nova TaxID=37330 RepID=A0A2S6AJJ4_9NOCA|nr:VOC family protein [Nocardia nova]PPJ25427.1 glyoxalase [Nocardia nova]PPJ35409.1 glyoxalase [Nocardia nova]
MTRKTYARVLTNDVNGTVEVLRELVGRAPDFQVTFGRFDIALIGDFCVVAGTDEALARYRGTVGPVIVADLDATLTLLERAGGEVTVPPFEGPAGRGFLIRHPDGVEFEYVQFRPDLAQQVFG